MGRISNAELESRRIAHLQRLPCANKMTPVALQTLIAHYCLPVVELPTEATQGAALYLARHQLLTEVYPGRYKITDRGQAHLAALVALPFPVAKTVWETPCLKEAQV